MTLILTLNHYPSPQTKGVKVGGYRSGDQGRGQGVKVGEGSRLGVKVGGRGQGLGGRGCCQGRGVKIEGGVMVGGQGLGRGHGLGGQGCGQGRGQGRGV